VALRGAKVRTKAVTRVRALEEKTMRTGDYVKHGPTGETWVVAYVDGPDLAWSGWPEGVARVADCTLVKACSDEEHEAHLREWADKPHRRDSGGTDHRHFVCKRQLEALLRERASVSGQPK
jgi:hypothetical protein